MLDYAKYPANINCTNPAKQNIVHLIVEHQFDKDNKPLKKLKNLFLNFGDRNIDTNARDKEGNTPLHSAGAYGNADAIVELLKHKADPTIKNTEGLTPYEYATRECKDPQKKSAVLAVLPKGAITTPVLPIATVTPLTSPMRLPTRTSTSENKTTAMHLAADSGDLEAVKMLVERDRLDIHAKNKDGLTALDLAYKNGHQKVTAYLFDKKLKSTQVKKVSSGELKVNYTDDQLLGDGASAWVYKGAYGNQPVAVKVVVLQILHLLIKIITTFILSEIMPLMHRTDQKRMNFLH